MTAAVVDQRTSLASKMIGAPESRLRTFALGSVAAALTFVGSFLNFVSFNAYALDRAEIVLNLAALAAIGLILGVIGALSRVLGRIIIPLLLVMLAVDINSNGTLTFWIGAVAGFLALRFVRQALALLFGIVTVTALWNAVVTGTPGSPASRHAPVPEAAPAAIGEAAKPDFAIIHVILDEHIGLEGIPDSLPRGVQERARLRQFYVTHGFRVFGGAYSEAMHRVNAIPRLLGLARPGAWGDDGRKGTVVRSNAYFDKLQAMGFQIDVAQTDWVDYCQHPGVTTCMTRPAGNPVDVGSALPTSDKAAILAYEFTSLSEFLQQGLNIYLKLAGVGRNAGYDLPVIKRHDEANASTLNGMATLEDTIDAARSIVPGRALFAHVLVPHYPYAYDPACNLRPLADWLGRLSNVSRERRYDAYLDQVDCVTTKIGELVAAAEQSRAAGKTVFIIHGDHGSRIMDTQPIAENKGKASERDLIDGYAALFAVSAPAIAPGYDRGRYPLRLLLSTLVESDFRSGTVTLPAGFSPTIVIENLDWIPVYERSMRDANWWNASPTAHAN